MRLHWGVAKLAMVVYFVQGSLGLASVALPLYLRAQGFSIAQIAFITWFATLPWLVKVVYGAISDGIPLWGYRRKSYLMLCSALSVVGWWLLAAVPPHTAWLITAMLLANMGLAATDVVADGLVVEHSVVGTAQIYQGISWGARSVGAMMAGITGGVLAQNLPAQTVFMITGVLPVISGVAAIFVEEERVRIEYDSHGLGSKIVRCLKDVGLSAWKSLKILFRGDLLWFALLLLIGSCGAAISTPFFFYMREKLLFDETFLGLLGSVGGAAAIIGCLLFLVYSRFVPLKKTLYIAFGVASVDVICTLFVTSHATAFAIVLFTGILGYLTLLPLLSAAAKLTHATGVEGSLFAILASVYNTGLFCAGIFGGFIFEIIGLKWLIVATALFMLLGLLVVGRIKSI
jgi:MFS family permease